MHGSGGEGWGTETAKKPKRYWHFLQHLQNKEQGWSAKRSKQLSALPLFSPQLVLICGSWTTHREMSRPTWWMTREVNLCGPLKGAQTKQPISARQNHAVGEVTTMTQRNSVTQLHSNERAG